MLIGQQRNCQDAVSYRPAGSGETKGNGEFELSSSVQTTNVRMMMLKSKVVHTRLRALSTELIPVSWQSARR